MHRFDLSSQAPPPPDLPRDPASAEPPIAAPRAVRATAAFLAIMGMLAAYLVTAAAPADAADHTFTGRVDAASNSWAAHRVQISDPSTVTATLDWTTTSADLNLGLRDPSGSWVQWSASSSARPEIIEYEVEPGEWTLGISAREGASDYTLRVAVEPHNGSGDAWEADNGWGSVQPWAIEQESRTHVWTEEEAVEAATNFPLITALRNSYRAHVPAMRRANPELELSVYMNGVFAQANQQDAYPPSWYLRDADGNKISNNWGIWLMDPANPGWVEDRAQTCLDFMSFSGYDGCFVDNLGPGAIWLPSLSAEPINPRTGRAWTRQEWMTATTALTEQLQATAAPSPVLVNGLGYGNEYFRGVAPTSDLLEVADGALAEIWLRAPSQGISSHRPKSAWLRDVELVADAVARGKTVMVSTKVWTDGSRAQKEAWHRFALASFMLADDGSNYFAFSYGRDEDPTVGNDLWSIDVGEPVGAYEAFEDVYRRDFSQGKVLVNPTETARTVQLDRAYVDPDGVERTSVRLESHSGTILRTSEADERDAQDPSGEEDTDDAPGDEDGEDAVGDDDGEDGEDPQDPPGDEDGEDVDSTLTRVADVRFADRGRPNMDVSLGVEAGETPLAGAEVRYRLMRDGELTERVRVTTDDDGSAAHRFRHLDTGCFEVVVEDVDHDEGSWDGATPENRHCR